MDRVQSMMGLLEGGSGEMLLSKIPKVLLDNLL